MAMNMGPPELKRRSELHLARRIWHALGVLTVTATFVIVERSAALALLSLVAIIFIIPDAYRLRHPKFNQFFVRHLRLLLRDSEANSLSGVTFIIVGIYITVALFSKEVATLSLLFLALGDPCAIIFGVLYGKDKLIGNKSLQGAFAAFIVCGLIAFAYYLVTDKMTASTERLFLVSILSGLIGALSETISIKKLDDNLTFPILSAIFLRWLFILFGA